MTKLSVRLSAGDLKGVAIPVPSKVRPTSGRVREALMDSWQKRLQGAELLDLFAGSGAVGLEALGRGATALLGLEAQPRVLEQLRRSYDRWSDGCAEARRAVLPGDLRRAVGERRFDLVFADPPYSFGPFDALLSGCSELLQPDGELALEHSTRVSLPERIAGLRLDRVRRHGESALSFYRLGLEGGNG